MATGQTLLTLASIVLLAIISMSIRSMYTQSMYNTVDSQITSDALNFGRDLAEEIHSYSLNGQYSDLPAIFSSWNDITDEEARREFTPQVGVTLYATFDVEENILLNHGQMGHLVTIFIYEEEREDVYREIAQYVTTVVDLS